MRPRKKGPFSLTDTFPRELGDKRAGKSSETCFSNGSGAVMRRLVHYPDSGPVPSTLRLLFAALLSVQVWAEGFDEVSAAGRISGFGLDPPNPFKGSTIHALTYKGPGWRTSRDRIKTVETLYSLGLVP